MFEPFLDIIRKYDSIVISGHAYPDGDCYGSQIGLREALRILFPEKHIYAIGSGLHRFFKLISEMDKVDAEVIHNSLIVILDANSIDRMEDQRVAEGKAFFKIDHHIENGVYHEGGMIVDDSAVSTCELIGDFIKEVSIEINPVIASALYLGNLTDSGRFQFASDFPRLFAQMNWLAKSGAEIASINQLLSMTDITSMAFKGFAYSHFRKTKAGVIYLFLNNEQVKRFHLSASRAASSVQMLTNIINYPVVAFFSEDESGAGRMEFRSTGPTVQPIAVKYGGGGHRLASGAPIEKYSLDFVMSIVDELDQLVLEYKKGKNG